LAYISTSRSSEYWDFFEQENKKPAKINIMIINRLFFIALPLKFVFKSERQLSFSLAFKTKFCPPSADLKFFYLKIFVGLYFL